MSALPERARELTRRREAEPASVAPPGRRGPSIHWYDGLLVAALIAAVVLAATTVGASSTATPTIRTSTVQRGVVQASVQATGNVVPAGTYAASFPTSGTVTEIDVSVGQWVTKGQTLAKIDPTQAYAQLVAAQSSLNAAESNLTQIEQVLTPEERNQIAVAEGQAQDAVDRANQTLATAQAQLTADQAANANAKLNADQQAVTQAENALTQAQDQQQTTLAADAVKEAPPQASQVDSADATIASAQANVASATKSVAGTVLTAPAAGVVTAINGSVGENVSGGGSSTISTAATGSNASSSSSGGGSSSGAGGSGGSGTSGGGATGGGGTGSGSSIASSSSSNNSSSSGSASSSGFITLTDMSSLGVNVGLAESDAVNVKLGQPATVTFSALPNVTLPGTVTSISPTSTLVSNVVTYNATVSLNQSDPGVKPGMTSSVTIITGERDNVLHVPSSAVSGTGTTGSVTVVNGKQQNTVTVGIGLRGDTDDEITSGLTQGQTVVTSRSTSGSGATGSGLTGILSRLRSGSGGLGGGPGGG
ncbi:MAG: HlyD family efflux transporter periplasmic adaptor subunit, partial [Actinobacteria bacterium]|nr:HlyD family efflux transporter periplasmic adaptor subunit [Actinomycetota bacterium]